MTSSDGGNPRARGTAAPLPNVPSPAGSKAGQIYTRFIPREELGDVKAWAPSALTGGDRRVEDRRGDARGTPDRRAQAPTPPPASPAANAPSAAELQARATAARQAGYKDGYRDGLAALEGFKQSFMQQTTAQIGTLLSAFDDQLNALDEDFAKAIARTAVQLAHQVLRAELQSRPETVLEVARHAVASLMPSARQVSLHVHPQDLPLISEGAKDVLSARGARLQADTSVARGGVLLKSDLGSVDARIETRWAEACAALGVEPASPAAPATPAAPNVPMAPAAPNVPMAPAAPNVPMAPAAPAATTTPMSAAAGVTVSP